MPLQLITAPRAEPISLCEAKTHARVTITAEDTFIGALIAAVRKNAQTKTQCQVMVARWKLVLDAFPSLTLMGVPAGESYTLPKHAVIMPIGPVLQIVSIKYLDMSGVQQTLSPTGWVADLAASPARITPPFGQIWPVTLPQIGVVEILFDAGMCAPLVANAGADTIQVTGWKTLNVGDTLRVFNRDQLVVADGALPGGLSANTDYYVQSVVGTDLYKLSATSGGAAIDITSAGTGDNFIGEMPQDLKAWMLLALGTLYENREAVIIDSRITVGELPTEFMDGLLDSTRLNLY